MSRDNYSNNSYGLLGLLIIHVFSTLPTSLFLLPFTHTSPPPQTHLPSPNTSALTHTCTSPSPNTHYFQSSPEPDSPVIKEVIAIADYSAQFGDELAFSAGDRIEVTADSESHSI